MENQKFEKIIIKLAKIEEKIDSICFRLDISNGKLLKHESQIDCLEQTATRNKLSIRIILGILSAVGLGILGLIFEVIRRKL